MISAARHERRGIQSADKAIEVLLALVDIGQPAPLRDLARVADMQTSLTHRYLASLVARGLAVQNPSTGLYDLGPLAIRIGASALSRVDALALAGAAMPALVAETGLTALLGVIGQAGPTIIRWERARMPFMTTLSVGAILPLTGSATGRVILAYLPKRLALQLIRLDQSIVGDDAESVLFRRLAEIRSRGFDTADSTVVPGLSAISAPILDAQDEAVAALTLIGSSSEMSKLLSGATEKLRQVSAQISAHCGSRLFL